MVTEKGPLKGVMLEVDTEEKTLPDVPDGYLHFMWPAVDSLVLPKDHLRGREIAGWVGLIGLLVLFLMLGRSTKREG